MFIPDEEFLRRYGWDDFFSNQVWPEFTSNSFLPARVISEERNLYRVQTGHDTTTWAGISGKMQSSAGSRNDYPAVGDWVLVEMPPFADRAVIHRIATRKSLLHRKQIGVGTDGQILSTNVDIAFVTTSATEDLNFRRIERYLAVVYEAGCTPVILLTKADLCGDAITALVAETSVAFPGIMVHGIAQQTFQAAAFLANYLKEGTTSVFIGSSGVGKSTIVNFLIGDDKIKTQEVRVSDGKGRHTTTSRHLYLSRFGGMVIDTPGMRELQLSSNHADGITSHFSDIEELISRCRFSNCRHDSEDESDCRIKEAIATNGLAQSRWRSYQKLAREVQRGRGKQQKAAGASERQISKKFRRLPKTKQISFEGDIDE